MEKYTHHMCDVIKYNFEAGQCWASLGKGRQLPTPPRPETGRKWRQAAGGDRDPRAGGADHHRRARSRWKRLPFPHKQKE